MKLTDRFERIFVINLAHRADRRKEMAEQLSRVGLSLTSPGVTLFEAVRPNDPAGFDSVGARGCFMSHLGVLRASARLRSVLILEDDLNFDDHICDRLSPALTALAGTWEVFYGGYRVQQTSLESSPLVFADPVQPVETTHFVAFNGEKTINCLAAYLEAMLGRPAGDEAGGPMHVDGAYSHFRADHSEMKTYLANPQLGYQRPSRTDIHAHRWFDRLPAVRNAAAWARRSFK